MHSKSIVQACRLGGAVQRGLISKEEVAKFLTVGHKAAEGDSAAIEVQAAFEAAHDDPPHQETLKRVDALLNGLFPAVSANPLKS